MRLKRSLKKIPYLMTVVTLTRKAFFSERSILFPGRSELLGRLGVMAPETIPKVLEVLGRAHSSPSFVKIGANDGLTGDPCGDIFLRDKRWRGLLVEPVDYCIDKLKNIYSDSTRFTICQVAIGHKQERRKFFFMAKEAKYSIPDMPEWYDQLGSFEREHVAKHFSAEADKFIIEKEIDVCPLSLILKRTGFVAPLILHIDVEGFDYEVLKSLNFRQSRPSVIMAEHKHLSASDLYSMTELLDDNGYLVLNAGEDILALSKTVTKALGATQVIRLPD
jgi:FkbM family methyltransferase